MVAGDAARHMGVSRGVTCYLIWLSFILLFALVVFVNTVRGDFCNMKENKRFRLET